VDWNDPAIVVHDIIVRSGVPGAVNGVIAMAASFGEADFRALRMAAEAAKLVRERLHRVLENRPVASFDGLGHLLDYALPDEPVALAQVALMVRISVTHLERLRASQVDPLALPQEGLAQLGCIAGLDTEGLLTLVERDHLRFAGVHGDASARSGEVLQQSLAGLRLACERMLEDSAEDL
jgi:hypothetical protein